MQISYVYGPLSYIVLPPGECICNTEKIISDVYTDLRSLMANFKTENFFRKPNKITCNIMYLYRNCNIQCLRTNCALSVSISVCCPQGPRPGISCRACSRITKFSPSPVTRQYMKKFYHKAHLHFYICSADSVAQLPVCCMIYCGSLTPCFFCPAPAIPLANRWLLLLLLFSYLVQSELDIVAEHRAE